MTFTGAEYKVLGAELRNDSALCTPYAALRQMPALTTADEFLDLLRKSRLVDDARLDAFL